MSALATTLALACIEGRRLLRQPLVLATAAIAGPLFAALIVVAGREAYYDWSLVVPFVPFAVATLVAVNLAALRARRDGAEDLYGSCPTTGVARTAAHLASLAWALAGVAVLVAIVVLAFMSKGNPLPSTVLAAMAPASVALCGTLGLALARWLPHPAVAATAAVAMLVVAGAGGDWSGPSRWPGTMIVGALVLAVLFAALAMLRDRSWLA